MEHFLFTRQKKTDKKCIPSHKALVAYWHIRRKKNQFFKSVFHIFFYDVDDDDDEE
jgi:hypothetical protein